MKVQSLPKISVCVIVYNQARYILDCLNSIASQKCSFNFEVIVRDDASTDGSGQLISDFITNNNLNHFRLIRAESNEGMMMNLINALHACKGDYIAFCEGDDYWTDDSKLEKQVCVMLNNPDCTLSVHPCYLHKSLDNKNSIGFHKGYNIKQINFNSILETPGQFAPSASYMIRKDIVDSFPSWLCNAPIGDFFIEMYSLKSGYGLYLPDVMCAYRVFSQGSWSDDMRKNNGRKMIRFGYEMQKCIQLMETEKAFERLSFNLLKSSYLLNIAIGHLLLREFSVFSDMIKESYATHPLSSQTQKWLYRLRSMPSLALLLFNIKRYLYTITNYK